jgi:hypothetical protein
MAIRNLASARRRLGGSVRVYRREESGSLIVFALFLFLLMALMGGFAIDLMRYEQTRTALQNTLDRCALMAASLTQRLDADDVLRDCVAKVGLLDQLEDVTVLEGLNFRTVQATGRVDTDPIFMPMIGIQEFYAAGAAIAEQRTTNVEIVLVLDVSGSMSGAKLANLKTAAAEFVNTVLSQDAEHRISVAIVPYNAQVNLGPVLRAKYNAVNQHGVANVNCVELPTDSFASSSLSRTLALPMMAYADIAYATNTTNGFVSPTDSTYARPNYGSAFCPPSTGNIVRLPGQNIAALQSQINALQAGGNTSIMYGMKWGLSLLDPAARPMFTELRLAGHIPATLADRPFDYTDREALKLIVLMTDGEHVAHNRVTDAYKTGPSPIFRSTGDGNYSIFHATRPAPNQYWVPHRSAWQATPWSNTATPAVPQSWEGIWANLKLTYVAWQFYGRALGTSSSTRSAAYNTAMAAMQSTYAAAGTMNSLLQQSCAQAKASNVVVYGIAFEAPANGQTQIRNCATSPAHYFNAQGLQIQTAFRSIASNLSQLKLTQ